MSKLEAVIFDVDGTLADTEDVHRRAFNQAFARFDLDWDWTPALYAELLAISGGRERIARYGKFTLTERFDDPESRTKFIRELHSAKTAIYVKMLTDGDVPLRSGVERLLEELYAAGITLAIATSSTFSNLKTLLDHNLGENWMSKFSAIATCDTVSIKKPSPRVYEAVLKILAVAPPHAVAVEDTVNGCMAARAAEITTIITTHQFTGDKEFPGAALVVDSLGEPDAPFTVRAGDPRGATKVDIGLLRALAAEREDIDLPEVGFAPAQIAAL